MEEKWIGQSKTFWGGLIVMLPSLAPIFGFTINPDQIEMLSQSGHDAIDGLSKVTGSLLFIYGLLKSSTVKTILPPKKKENKDESV